MSRHRWRRAVASRRPSGEMNGTELDYARLLENRRDRKEIAAYAYEPIKLKLAPSTFYTPDFLVQLEDGTLEFHEVKACRSNDQYLVEDDAKVKIKVAAREFPCFRFFMCGKLTKNRGWRIEEVG